MGKHNITTLQATEDANKLIIYKVISLSTTHDIVIIVGEDVNLLVLLTCVTPAPNRRNIFFTKCGRGQHVLDQPGPLKRTTFD